MGGLAQEWKIKLVKLFNLDMTAAKRGDLLMIIRNVFKGNGHTPKK